MDTNTRAQQGSHRFPVDPASRQDWVGAWYAAPIQMQPAHLTGRTLYQIVHLHMGGRQIRLRFMSVLNAGICFNELLAARTLVAGDATLHRLAWDVLEQAAVTDVIVQIGINDLRHDAQATAIINGLQQLATRVRKNQLRIFGTTILPGSYTPEQAVQRRIVNTWLHEQGTQEFDAIFDFATSLQHPEDEIKLCPDYNSGDDIHPNDAGYQRMAEAVDLTQLTGSPTL